MEFYCYSNQEGRSHNQNEDADVRDRSNSGTKNKKDYEDRRMQALFARWNGGTMSIDEFLEAIEHRTEL